MLEDSKILWDDDYQDKILLSLLQRSRRPLCSLRTYEVKFASPISSSLQPCSEPVGRSDVLEQLGPGAADRAGQHGRVGPPDLPLGAGGPRQRPHRRPRHRPPLLDRPGRAERQVRLPQESRQVGVIHNTTYRKQKVRPLVTLSLLLCTLSMVYVKQATRRNIKIQFHQMEHSIKGLPLSKILTRKVLFLVQVIKSQLLQKSENF